MLVFLFASAIYLYAFPQPNIFYAVVVLLHAVVGLLATVYLIILLVQLLREASWIARLGWLLVLASAVLGSVLIKIGALRADYDWLYLHIGVALTGCGFLFGDWAGKRGWLSPGIDAPRCATQFVSSRSPDSPPQVGIRAMLVG